MGTRGSRTLLLAAAAAATVAVGSADAVRISAIRVLAPPKGILTKPADGSAFTHRISFTDSNNPARSQLSATIGWGDGNVTAGTIGGPSGGVYTVSGTHTWVDEGPENVVVTIVDSSTSPATTAQSWTTYTVAEGDLALVAVPASIAEGQETTEVLLQWTDGGGTESDNPYTAFVDWSDGTEEIATVTGGPGGYAVSVPGSSHFYGDEGKPTAIVTVNESGVQQSPLFVAKVPITVTEGDIVSNPTLNVSAATEGAAVPAGTTVATFTDSNVDNVASDFAATVKWGDGTSSAGAIVYSFGTISVVTSTDHTYADEGEYSASVALREDNRTTPLATATGQIAVSEADSLRAQPKTFNPVEGAAFTGTAATFTDSFAGAKPTDFTATIDWGDGSANNVQLGGGNGTFSAKGTHTYAEEGAYEVAVTIVDDAPGSAFATAISSAIVADAPLRGTGKALAERVGVSFTAPVASFTDADPNGTRTDYSATIAWGDGASSAGTVKANATGGFDVIGTHKYAKAGAFNPKLTIQDAGGSSASPTATVTVT